MKLKCGAAIKCQCKGYKKLFINKKEWEEDSEERNVLVKTIRHYGSKSTRGDWGKPNTL